MMSIGRIEVHARRNRNARILENSLAETKTVIGEGCDIGVDVKGAVGWRDTVQAHPRQCGKQQITVFAVGCDMSVELFATLESCGCRVLAQ